jgi:hypothetical protein
VTVPTGAAGVPGRVNAGAAYRPARPVELAACADIWRASINDYILPLGQMEIPPEQAPLLRLYAHLQATDPDRFVVAVVPDPAAEGAERIVGFAAAVMRERLWFLSMCFVLPEMQGAGVGRALLTQVAPPEGTDVVRATATDSAQPISNALYASLGIVPKLPLLNLIGHPLHPDAFGPLPSGIRPVPFEELVGGPAGVSGGSGGSGAGHAELAAEVDTLDRDLLGVAHPLDHRYLRVEGRRGWLYLGPDGTPVGYGYATEAGRVGPVAARDADLLAPILGHLTDVVTPRGAFAMWLPGSADRAVVASLAAGFRLDQFPILLCWDRPFADFTRYLPISPGLL